MCVCFFNLCLVTDFFWFFWIYLFGMIKVVLYNLVVKGVCVVFYYYYLCPFFFVELVKEGKMVWCFFWKRKYCYLFCHVILFCFWKCEVWMLIYRIWGFACFLFLFEGFWCVFSILIAVVRWGDNIILWLREILVISDLVHILLEYLWHKPLQPFWEGEVSIVCVMGISLLLLW